MTSAPFDEHREVVHPEWIDENGHFNMGYYMVAFDRATALRTVRSALRAYVGLPDYQRFCVEVGFADEVNAIRAALEAEDETGVLEGISARMAEGLSICCTPAQARKRVEAWQATGIDHVTLVPVIPSAILRSIA